MNDYKTKRLALLREDCRALAAQTTALRTELRRMEFALDGACAEIITLHGIAEGDKVRLSPRYAGQYEYDHFYVLNLFVRDGDVWVNLCEPLKSSGKMPKDTWSKQIDSRYRVDAVEVIK